MALLHWNRTESACQRFVNGTLAWVVCDESAEVSDFVGRLVVMVCSRAWG